MTAKKIALFIDADNISAKFGKQIIETLETRGEIFIRRIYGNWEKFSLHGWNECILNFSLRAVQQPDFATGKNATDMSLTIDAMDVLYGGKAEIFALVSNDSDFTPLAIRLREGGMKIIGLGNSHASNSFRSACSEFIDLDEKSEAQIPAGSVKNFSPAQVKISPVQISLFDEETISPPAKIQPVEKIPVATPVKVQPVEMLPKLKVISIADRQLQCERDKKLQQIHNVLCEAANLQGDENGFLFLNSAGKELKNKKLGFTVRDFGYGTLQDFVAAFPNLYEVTGSGGTISYRCLVGDTLQQIHETLRETAEAHGDESGFVKMSWAGDAIGKKNLSVKSFGHDTLSKFIAAFPNLYEVTGSGGTISYRCLVGDTLQQIHETLRETAEAHGDESGFVKMSWAGDAIGKKNLSVKSFGHDTLSKFIAAFPNLYEVTGSGGTISYRCLVGDTLQQIHETLRETANTYRDEKGFTNLGQAGNALIQKNLNVKSFGHNKLNKFLADFPQLYELGNNSYRCR